MNTQNPSDWVAPIRGEYVTTDDVAPIGHNSGWGTPLVAQADTDRPKFEVKYAGQSEYEDPEAFRLRRNAEIEHWLAAKPVLENAKTNEADLRAKVTATLFPTPKKGTQRYDIGRGYKVKLVHSMTPSLGNKEAVDAEGKAVAIEAQVRALEDRIIDGAPARPEVEAFEGFGPVGEQILKRVIKWKPELSLTEYEKLDEAIPAEKAVRDAIAEILTLKPASPQLTFEEPKEK